MPIQQILNPRQTDLGGAMVVRRALPLAERRSIGPFLFFDHFGPHTLQPGDAMDVRPHPHIGLATVSYLFEGAIQHRDDLGFEQRIEPGAINWMTAGRGIVHSERTPGDLRQTPHTLHGLQLWAALPVDQEECAPSFTHTPAEAIPEYEAENASVRVLIGEAFGLRSPVETLIETLYLDIALAANASLTLPATALERGLYLVDGALQIDGQALETERLAVLDNGQAILQAGPDGARCALIGGEALTEHRHIYWNFVSTRQARIEQAKADWQAGRFGTVPGETEFIPLPAR